jgi:hypothetical protein
LPPPPRGSENEIKPNVPRGRWLQDGPTVSVHLGGCVVPWAVNAWS